MLSPLVLPLHGNRLVRALNARLLPRARARARRASWACERPILWAYVPQAEVLIDALDPSLVVYHCVDDIAAHERIDTASFRAAEERFAARADLVLASAPALAAAACATLSDNVLDAPNVADTELFAEALERPARSTRRWPRCPRRGSSSRARSSRSSSTWRCSSSSPGCGRDWSFALVGPIGPGDPRTDVSALAAEPNVHLLGARAYERAAGGAARRPTRG